MIKVDETSKMKKLVGLGMQSGQWEAPKDDACDQICVEHDAGIVSSDYLNRMGSSLKQSIIGQTSTNGPVVQPMRNASPNKYPKRFFSFWRVGSVNITAWRKNSFG